jgi:phosphate transport system permease protein
MVKLSLFAPALMPNRRKWKRILIERGIEVILLLAALSSVLTTFGIMEILVIESYNFFRKVAELRNTTPISFFLGEFLNEREWSPLFEGGKFGILPLLTGTLVTTGVAIAFAIPIGTIISIYLSEFASSRTREIIKPILELLAGIPSVVFGYFALTAISPALQSIILAVQKYFMPGLGEFDYFLLPGFNMLSAGLAIGIAIIPLISSISEDAMRSVPLQMREGSYATGATRLQTALRVVLPASFSGVVAAYILGISRAIGETMIVAIAAGLQPNFTWNPLESAATVSAYIVQVSLGDIPHGSIEYDTIFIAGLSLVLMTLVLNIIGYFLSKRFREVY